MLTGTSRNIDGALYIGGLPVKDLAGQYGTPLFVLDEEHIRHNCQQYRDAFCAGNRNRIAYAGKAMLTIAICQLIEEEGLYLDVVSGGELYTALAAGFPSERIYFHGNNKSSVELSMVLDARVGTIVVDNLHELSLLDVLTRESKRKIAVLLRVALGVDAATHKYIQTGQHDSKFGFAINSDELAYAVRFALSHDYIELQGYHSHIGSQIQALSGFAQAVEVMYNLVEKYMAAFGFVPAQLNFGGGLGIRYTEDEPDLTIVDLVSVVKKYAEAHNERLGIDPLLVLEPGRSIIGSAGMTLYSIGAVKEIKGIRTFVSVDGGMTDNPRPALYGARYECAIADKLNQPRTTLYSIAGKCCESGDMLIWDAELPPVSAGDILAVFATGAYSFSMASNYNRLPRPAVVLVKDLEARVIVERETYADIIARDKPLR
ncbi:MAG TPA: diaminopimelate decarboxylase [Bacillota bacterium]|nr:diaminopimelate decarboxylase [Bacillota bacterium]